MVENSRYSISSEIGIPYELQVRQYISIRFDQLNSTLVLSDKSIPPKTRISDVKNFAIAVSKAAPIYLVEQFAPNAKSYSSLRGAGYSEMSLGLAGRSIFDYRAVDTIKLNHEFRASANALDAVVDEIDGITNRENLKHLRVAEGFRRSKKSFFDNIRNVAKNRGKAELGSIGNVARRYQMHQDLYLDLAKMKKDGIESTRFLKYVPEPATGFPFSREQMAFLIVLGIDGETLLVDSLAPVNSRSSFDSEVRDAAFWGAVVGTLGDQWADILQDFCGNSDNMFIDVLNKFPSCKKAAARGLSSLESRGKDLLGGPSSWNKISFFRLQLEAHAVLKRTAPEVVYRYGQLIAEAFDQIPSRYQKTLIPIRFAAWDWVSLYQLSDFLLHLDKYEEEARAHTKQLATQISKT